MSEAVNEGGVWMALRRTGKGSRKGVPLSHWLRVSPEDVDFLRDKKWRFYGPPQTRQSYARLKDGSPNGTTLHRVLAKRAGILTDESMLVDHINGDPHDCRRENLRQCTCAQNSQNIRASTRSSHGYRGVAIAARGRFSARVCVGGRRHFLGYFSTPQEASVVAAEFRRKAMPFAVDR